MAEVVSVFTNLESCIFTREIERVTKLQNKFADLDQTDLDIIGLSKKGFDNKFVDARLSKLNECTQIAKIYKPVVYDHAAKRKVPFERKSNYGSIESQEILDISLIFTCPIPVTKKKHSFSFTGKKSNYEVSARVPNPPLEAIKALSLVEKNTFDSFNLWWVPKDVFVKEIKPDPIIVGMKKVPRFYEYGEDYFYFEIYRWIDETVENPYWASEAY